VIDGLLGPLLGARMGDGPKVPAGVVLRRGRWLTAVGGWCAGMRGRAAAVTIGRTIVVHPDVVLDRRLIDHELEHVRQWREHPVTFPARYILNHFRYGYRNNPYEVEARRAEHAASPREGYS
jgi:hypothetical protein